MRTGARLGPWVFPVALALALLALTLLVAVDHAAAIGPLDRAVERWVSAHRTVDATALFRFATHLGDPGSAFTGGLLLAGFAAIRSRRSGLVLLVLALARPVASSALKDAVDRPRPQLSQLVTATGAAYPSGHTLAGCAFWGAVPAVVLVWSGARAVVRATGVLAVVMVVLVAASRVYLGVHWLSDVVAGALLGLLLLVPVYRLVVPRLGWC